LHKARRALRGALSGQPNSGTGGLAEATLAKDDAGLR
jgi:hypothetical protein